MCKERIRLSGEWELYYCRESAFGSLGFDGGEAGLVALPKLKATVPGCFEKDFSEAGILPKDLFYSTNILLLQNYEDLHLFYVKTFASDLTRGNLVFEGIDTLADIYLNGEKILSCDNMMIAFEAKGVRLQAQNTLLVHIRPTIVEARKYELPNYCFFSPYTRDSAYIRKPPHMFGWDIVPRAVSGGIWKDVYLEAIQEKSIVDFYAYTREIKGTSAKIEVAFSFETDGEEYEYELTGDCKGSDFRVCDTFASDCVRFGFEIENARLWAPKNYGEPNLYDMKLAVKKGGEVVAVHTLRFGVRTVELERSSVVDENGGKFCFIVNGQRIYVLGTNWTPLSPFHYQDAERLEPAFNLLLECNCNAVRCWGGNVYESERFYDLCDENGILVWQDFAMACGYYPQEEPLFSLIRVETEAVVKRLRNRACLALWSGDNECDINIRHSGGDPKDNLLTRKVIPEVLDRLDCSRPYLPSSPYLDEYAFSSKLPTSEDHTWGDRSYYKGEYYKNTVCCFASEMGFTGAPAVESLKKYISPEQLWDWKDDKGYEGFDPEGKNFIDAMNKDKPKDDWLIHSTAMETTLSWYSYQVPLLAYSAAYLFGSDGDDIYRFVMKSQATQAEAFKWNIERYRLAKWHKTGLMWWNLIDCWPGSTNTIVDFYFKKKLAFEFVKRSQNPLIVTFKEAENGEYRVTACNDLQEDKTVEITVTNLTSGKVEYKGSACALANANTDICLIPADSRAFYKIEFRYDGKAYLNHYIDDLVGYDFEEYIGYLKQMQVDEYIVLE